MVFRIEALFSNAGHSAWSETSGLCFVGCVQSQQRATDLDDGVHDINSKVLDSPDVDHSWLCPGEVPPLKVKRDVDQADEHRHFHQRTNDGSERRPGIDAEYCDCHGYR